jgi:non-structural maintenance of chromosomes element 1
MITKGVRCHRDNKCQVRLHFHCFKTYRKRKSTCPVCQQEWPTNPESPLILIGEGAAGAGDDARKRTRRQDVDEHEDEDESMMDTSQSQPPQTQGKSKGKRRATRSNRVDDDAEDED